MNLNTLPGVLNKNKSRHLALSYSLRSDTAGLGEFRYQKSYGAFHSAGPLKLNLAMVTKAKQLIYRFPRRLGALVNPREIKNLPLFRSTLWWSPG